MPPRGSVLGLDAEEMQFSVVRVIKVSRSLVLILVFSFKSPDLISYLAILGHSLDPAEQDSALASQL